MSSSPLQLLAGLGNPGKDYANTRHNAGAWLIAEIAASHAITLRSEAKYQGAHGILKLPDDESCHLLLPATYMNRSGQAIRACANYYKIPPQAILIAHDDIDLPVGTVKLKFDGGDGGHNGLIDIIDHLHTQQFYRLRIGVGRPNNNLDVSDYVLSAPSKSDRALIDLGLEKIQSVLPMLLAGEFAAAMQKLHTTPPTL